MMAPEQGAHQAELPEIDSREPSMGQLLPGWSRVVGKPYVQSACERVRIYRAQPQASATQMYTVAVRLAGQWIRLRANPIDLADAARDALQVVAELKASTPADGAQT